VHGLTFDQAPKADDRVETARRRGPTCREWNLKSPRDPHDRHVIVLDAGFGEDLPSATQETLGHFFIKSGHDEGDATPWGSRGPVDLSHGDRRLRACWA